MSRHAFLAVSAALTAFLLVLVGAVGSFAVDHASAPRRLLDEADARLRARDEALDVTQPTSATFVRHEDDDGDEEHGEHLRHHEDEDDDG